MRVGLNLAVTAPLFLSMDLAVLQDVSHPSPLMLLGFTASMGFHSGNIPNGGTVALPEVWMDLLGRTSRTQYIDKAYYQYIEILKPPDRALVCSSYSAPYWPDL